MSKWLIFKNSHFDLKSALSHSDQAYAQKAPVNTWRMADLDQAEYNSHGSFSGGGGTGSCLSIDICPDLILAAIAVAAGGAVFLIYQAITVAGRRRKRDDHNEEDTFFGSFFSLFLPKYLGLEDFLPTHPTHQPTHPTHFLHIA